MPCYVPDPTPEEIEESQRQSNEKKYGFYLNNHELIVHLLNMCCEMGNAINEVDRQRYCHNGWQYVSQETCDWFVEHQKRDNEIKKAELIAKIDVLQKEDRRLSEQLNDINEEIRKLGGELAVL